MEELIGWKGWVAGAAVASNPPLLMYLPFKTCVSVNENVFINRNMPECVHARLCVPVRAHVCEGVGVNVCKCRWGWF